MNKVNGVSNISDSHDPMLGIKQVPIPYNYIEVMDGIRKILNKRSISMIPYCNMCKRSLEWHIAESESEQVYGRLLFSCRGCGRQWIMSEEEVEESYQTNEVEIHQIVSDIVAEEIGHKEKE